MMECGLVEIVEVVNEKGEPDIEVRMDREKIATVGKQAIGDFLAKLQMIKSTANIDEGKKLFAKYDTVTLPCLPLIISVIAKL